MLHRLPCGQRLHTHVLHVLDIYVRNRMAQDTVVTEFCAAHNPAGN